MKKEEQEEGISPIKMKVIESTNYNSSLNYKA